ncbi:MAG: arylesterase [Lachnospiraceae bacterium]
MKKILCYGDSNTWGLIPGTQNRFPQNVRWTGLPIDGAVLMLGTNDCKACYKADARQIAKGMECCIDELLRYIPAENTLVVSPIYLGESVWKPQYDPEFDEVSVETSKQLHAEYQKAAHRKNVRIIAASDFVKASETDQEHLDETGHWILAEAIYQALNSMNIPCFSSII